MPKPRKAIETVLTAIAVAIVLCLCVLGIATLFYWPPSSRPLAAVVPGSSVEWASWIQAIGTILAVMGAFWIGAAQVKHDREMTREHATTREASFYKIIELLYHQASVTATWIENGNLVSFRTNWSNTGEQQFRSMIAAYDALPLHELGSSGRIFCAVNVRSAAQAILRLAEDCNQREKYGDRLPSQGTKQIQYLHGRLWQEFEALKDSYLGVH